MGKTRKGNRWLKPLLVECGWGAGRGLRTYLGAQYARLAAPITSIAWPRTV
jgi:hypothetical protein